MWHTLFVSNNGTLWGCGTGNYRRHDEYEASDFPVKDVYPRPVCTHPWDLKFRVVVAGMQHSAAICCSGQLYVWGKDVCVTRNQNIVGAPSYENYCGVFSEPEHMHPKAFAYTRLGRWHDMCAERAMAFMMISHKVLGRESFLKDLDDELLQMIMKHTHFEPRADTGSALRKLIGFET